MCFRIKAKIFRGTVLMKKFGKVIRIGPGLYEHIKMFIFWVSCFCSVISNSKHVLSSLVK